MGSGNPTSGICIIQIRLHVVTFKNLNGVLLLK